MSVKPDSWIKKMAKESKMIEPFEPGQVSEGVLSYGTSSYGYDMRVSDEYRILRGVNSDVIDPKSFNGSAFREHKGNFCLIPPGSLCLARSVEYFRIPRNIITICFGKSSYARCGVLVNVTPFEPEWEGHVTISISNTTNLPVKIYSNEGIAQVLFIESDRTCETSYADRKGKYQGQKGIIPPKIANSVQ